MAIIISEAGKNARKLDQTSLAREEFLQAYIKDNPHTIPINEIKENLRLLVLAREFQTISGPIDALGADQDGNLYIIETKLAKNPDKRLVIAQALDYGAALWRANEGGGDEFISALEGAVYKTHDQTLTDKARDFFADDIDDPATWLQTLRERVRGGDFRFVVLMDHIDDRLKNLITFVSRNSQFTIYAVEMEFYQFDRYELLIPRLFGAEVTKETSAPKPVGARQQQQWDDVSFFARVESDLTTSQVAGVRKLYEFAQRSGKVKWQSNQKGSFSVKFPQLGSDRAFYTVYSNGMLALSLGWHEDARAVTAAEQLRRELRQSSDLDDGKNFESRDVIMQADVWLPHVDVLISMLERVIATPHGDAEV